MQSPPTNPSWRIAGAFLMLAGLLTASWRIYSAPERSPNLGLALELAARAIRAPQWEQEVARHGAAIYALASALPNSSSPAAQGELRALIKSSPPLVTGQIKPNMSFVETPPILGMRSRSALLGISALRLVSLLSGEKAQPYTERADQIRSLGNFLLFLQKHDGSFYYSLDLNTGKTVGTPDLYEQSRSSGQAALALVLLANWDETGKKTVWWQAARKAIDHQRSRIETMWPDFGIWTLLALEKFLRFSPLLPVEDAKTLRHFASLKMKAEISQRIDLQNTSLSYGCYDARASVLVTASRLEGILAALAITLSETSEDENRTGIRAAQLALGCLLKAQLKSGPFRGAFGASSAKMGPEVEATLQATLAIAHYRELHLPLVPFSENDVRGRLVARQAELWSENSLTGLRLKSAYLKGWLALSATFIRCDFRSSIFSDGSFANASFIESSLRGASFSNADMRELRAEGSDFVGAKFERSDLRAADFSFSDLTRASFLSVDLRGASFLGARLVGASYDQYTQLPFDRVEANRRGLRYVASP